MPTALITGIGGQDGSYLAELLLDKGYRVSGTERDLHPDNLRRIAHLRDRVEVYQDDLTRQESLERLFESCRPDEVYNLASPSSLSDYVGKTVETAESVALGVTRLLEAIRIVNPSTRFFQASSSELFGGTRESPQTENTPFHPRNSYGVAKLYGHWITVNYRETYGMFTCCGILYNHESPRRGTGFVTRKITRRVAEILLGRAVELRLGNLDAQRDRGFAGDFVKAMWLMLQYARPDDYILATGVTHSVRELCEIAFSHAGLDYRDHVVPDSSFTSPEEPVRLVGDASKARNSLGWKSEVTLRELIGMMVDADVKALQSLESKGNRETGS